MTYMQTRSFPEEESQQPKKKRRKLERKGTSRWTRYRQAKEDLKRWTSESQTVEEDIGVSLQPRDDEDHVSESIEVDSNNDDDYCILEQDDDDDEVEVGDSTKAGDYEIDRRLSFRDQLARWSVSFNVTGTAFSVLLKILLAYEVVLDLPRDRRTVLGTARSVLTKKMPGGEYFHFGLTSGLCNILNSLSSTAFDRLDNILNIVINMDGLPCFKSVNTHFWPILCSLHAFGKSSSPFTIGVFYGVEKEKNLFDYLADFVSDYNICRTDGFKCRGRLFKVNVHAVVCDAPARAFVKNVYNFASRYPCERCCIGSDRNRHRFILDNANPRTDTNVLKLDDKHNKGPSPLSSCNIKLVSQVVIDYMHLVLLGILKKLLIMWLFTKKQDDRHDIRLASAVVDQISQRLLSYIETCPKEFARKPRSLSNVRMFKATEFRTFLLYTGMISIKGLVRSCVYQNFLLLVCSMRIFLSDQYCAVAQYRQHAKEMCKAFVSHYRTIYGLEKVVYNVHNLLHIHEDAERYGNLERISAFPFENHLQSYKRKIRSGSNTLQQLVRRIDEEQRFAFQEQNMFDDPKENFRFLHPHDFPLPSSLKRYQNEITGQYKVVEYKGIRFSVFAADSCIRLPDSSVGKIVNIVKYLNGDCVLVYRVYRKRMPFFDYPMDSEAVGISHVESLSEFTLITSVTCCKKAWLLPTSDRNKWLAVDLL